MARTDFNRLSAPLARLTALTDESFREMRAVPLPAGEARRQAEAWLASVREQVRTSKRLQGVVRERDQQAFARFVQEEGPALEARQESRAEALGLEECAGGGGEQSAAAAPAQPESPAPAPAPEGDGGGVVRGALGEPVRVTSPEGDVVMRAVRVRPRVRENEYSPVPEGQKAVGVDLEIRNVGSETFNPPLSATTRLIDTSGGQGRFTTIIEGTCGQGFALRLAVTPDTAEQGCIPFAIDEDARPARLQVQLGHGQEQVIAEFDLRSGASRDGEAS